MKLNSTKGRNEEESLIWSKNLNSRRYTAKVAYKVIYLEEGNAKMFGGRNLFGS